MKSLTLRHLRAIQAIHRHGTIAAAARRLGLTGPAVTLQLKQLEDECGLALFDRTGAGMRLTAVGAAVLQAANAVETTLRSLSDEIDAIKGVRYGSIRLGVISTAKYFAPRLIAAFQREHPGIEIQLIVGNRSEIVAFLRSHHIETALMGSPPTDLPVRATIFGDHSLVMIAAPEHPLVAQQAIPRSRLLQEKILIREPGSGTRLSLQAFFADHAEAFEAKAVEMGSNETIKQAVMAGLGVALISADTIVFEVEMKRLMILDVTDLPIRRHWFVVSRQERVPSPTGRTFEAFLSEKGRGLLPASEQVRVP